MMYIEIEIVEVVLVKFKILSQYVVIMFLVEGVFILNVQEIFNVVGCKVYVIDVNGVGDVFVGVFFYVVNVGLGLYIVV